MKNVVKTSIYHSAAKVFLFEIPEKVFVLKRCSIFRIYCFRNFQLRIAMHVIYKTDQNVPHLSVILVWFQLFLEDTLSDPRRSQADT